MIKKAILEGKRTFNIGLSTIYTEVKGYEFPQRVTVTTNNQRVKMRIKKCNIVVDVDDFGSSANCFLFLLPIDNYHYWSVIKEYLVRVKKACRKNIILVVIATQSEKRNELAKKMKLISVNQLHELEIKYNCKVFESRNDEFMNEAWKFIAMKCLESGPIKEIKKRRKKKKKKNNLLKYIYKYV